MIETEVERSLLSILEVIEAQSKVSAELVDTCKMLMGRDLELQDGIADLTNRLTFVASRNRLLVNMKAATLTQTCRRCGCEYAKEPGPELCGPCWTELGRPERYLEPVGA